LFLIDHNSGVARAIGILAALNAWMLPAYCAEPAQIIPRATVALDSPAYVDMPIWLHVKLPRGMEAIRYPYVLGLAGFGCNQVEVRRNGKLLSVRPELSRSHGIFSMLGEICGSYPSASTRYAGHLPLHLIYRFTEPGTYEVRFTQWTQPWDAVTETSVRSRSKWTAIEVLPSRPGQRAAWLGSVREHLPSEPGEILSDTLPSVLGVADEASFAIVSGYLEHPDPSVRQLAEHGLDYWPEKDNGKRTRQR
jgi:hypothetical protein